MFTLTIPNCFKSTIHFRQLSSIFFLSCMFPNIGPAFILPIDNQITPPFIALLLFGFSLARHSQPLSLHRSAYPILFGLLIAILLSFFALYLPCPGELSERFRSFITYILIFVVFTVSTFIPFTLDHLSRLLKFCIFFFLLGCVFNLAHVNTSFMVNRNIFFASGVRGLPSFFSEQSYVPAALSMMAILNLLTSSSVSRSLAIFSLSFLSGAGQILLCLAIYALTSFIFTPLVLLAFLKINLHLVKNLFARLSFLFISLISIFLVLLTSTIPFTARISLLLRDVISARSLLILDSSASYKVSGLYFALQTPLLHPFDICPNKSLVLREHYPSLLSSWNSFSSTFFSFSGYGSRPYSILGTIPVDFGIWGWIILFFFSFAIIYSPIVRSLKHSTSYLYIIFPSLVVGAGFMVAGVAFWTFWCLLGLCFNSTLATSISLIQRSGQTTPLPASCQNSLQF